MILIESYCPHTLPRLCSLFRSEVDVLYVYVVVTLK